MIAGFLFQMLLNSMIHSQVYKNILIIVGISITNAIEFYDSLTSLQKILLFLL